MRTSQGVVLAAAMGLSLAACDTYVGTNLRTPTQTFLTDSPFPYDRVARVDLYVVSVSGSLTPDTSVGNGSFVTLAAPHRQINVLALQNGKHDLLGTADLPVGTITAVRMVIDTDSSSITLKDGRVLTGTSTPGIQWQSSAGRPTLNAIVTEYIDVPSTGGLVVIDYDVGEAFVPMQEVSPGSTDSSFIFSPVLKAMDANLRGWVMGIVRAQSASGLNVVDASLQLFLGDPAQPENTWLRMATARSDSSGVFRFASVTRSVYWEGTAQAGKTYIVTVDPPSGSALGRVVIPNVTVIAATGTDLGVVVLP